MAGLLDCAADELEELELLLELLESLPEPPPEEEDPPVGEELPIEELELSGAMGFLEPHGILLQFFWAVASEGLRATH